MASVITTPPAAKMLTRNPMYVTLESDKMSGSEAPYTPDEPNLTCRLEVVEMVEGSPARTLATLRAPYSTTDKKVTFDIHKVFPRSISLPTAQSIGISPGTPYHGEAEGIVMEYRLDHTQMFGTPPAAESVVESDTFVAIQGGVPADALQNINFAGSLIGLHSYFYKRHSAFIFRKPVSPDQPDWIYFVSLVEDTIEVTVTRHFDDGTYDSFKSHEMEVEPNKAYWTQSGYEQLKVKYDPPPGKEIIGYDVSLVRQTGPVNAFTAFYVLDNNCPSWERYFLMHNGFGGYESVRMKGKTSYSHQVERESFERTRWSDFTTEEGTFEDISTSGGAVWQTHTGHYPKWYLNHLRQLLQGNLWYIDQELSAELNTHRFLKIQCLSNSAELYRDDPAGAEGFAIQYRQAWRDDGFNVF